MTIGPHTINIIAQQLLAINRINIWLATITLALIDQILLVVLKYNLHVEIIIVSGTYISSVNIREH